MSKDIENYVQEARRAGMSNSAIVEKLSAAGWVKSEVEAVILAIDTNSSGPQASSAPQQIQQQSGPKQHLSIRKLPDMFMESIWKKLF